MYRINHGAVVVVTILQQIVRYIWYSPSVFFDQWLSAFRLDPVAMTDISLLPTIIAIISSLTFCYLFAWLVNRLSITNIFAGIGLALLLWLPHAGLWTTSQYLFASIPWSAILVDAFGTLVNIVLAGMILTLWRKRIRLSESTVTKKVEP